MIAIILRFEPEGKSLFKNRDSCYNEIMGRRKIQEKNVRSLTKSSNGKSYTITLPIDVVRRWRWKNRQKLQLTIDDKRKRIIIGDWER